jgi:hypothetical protein
MIETFHTAEYSKQKRIEEGLRPPDIAPQELDFWRSVVKLKKLRGITLSEALKHYRSCYIVPTADGYGSRSPNPDEQTLAASLAAKYATWVDSPDFWNYLINKLNGKDLVDSEFIFTKKALLQ